jgi:hypothetical protein
LVLKNDHHAENPNVNPVEDDPTVHDRTVTSLRQGEINVATAQPHGTARN